jgi:signal transduction histidine kinase/CheY-like chemotaxis protein
MSDARTLILVHSPEIQGSLEALAQRLPWAPSRGLTFALLVGDVQRTIAEHRAREGLSPIGFVARDEPSALAALAGGADEALVLTTVDATTLAAFVDRVELRAGLRAEGERLRETFAHAEKLTALGTLVAGIGHEINNPLAAMLLSIDAARRYVLPALDASWEIARAARFGTPLPQGALDQLAKLGATQGRTGRDATRILDDIGAAADSIASIVRDLRVFARTDQEEPPELVGVEELIDQALRLVSRELFHHALLERDYAPDLPKLVVPRNRVTQVLINVLINAAHATRDVDRPNHRVRISARADDEFVAIAVSDTGPGIAPDSVGRIFDPFYTTKHQEEGTGLGLAISRSILRRLGGDLSVESVYGDGATFLCFLPIPTRDAVRTACEHRTATVRGTSSRAATNHSVLVVDDDERVLRSYMRLLNPEHRLLIAQDGGDAIELLESGSAPDAVLLELDLPGIDGTKLLAWLAEHRPDLHRHALVVTSVGAQPEYETFLRNYGGPVLHKPVRGEELLAEIARVLA